MKSKPINELSNHRIIELKFFLYFILILVGLLNANSLHATTIRSLQSGDFNLASTWVGGVAPLSLTNDTIVIANGDTVRLTVPITLKYLIIDSGGVLDNMNNNILTIKEVANSGILFTINGLFTGTAECRIYVVSANSANNHINGKGNITTGIWDFFGNASTPAAAFQIDTTANLTFNFSGAMSTLGMSIGRHTAMYINMECYGSITMITGNFMMGNDSKPQVLIIGSTGTINLLDGRFTLSGGTTVHNNGVVTVVGNINSNDNINNYWYNHENSTVNVTDYFLMSSAGSGITCHLMADYPNNTINYNGSGDQRLARYFKPGSSPVISPNAVYWHLKCSNAGIKSLLINTIVKGNLTISDAAQLDVSASSFSIDLKGHWADTSTNAEPFIEHTGKVTFSGDTLQTITASHLAGGETFYNLVINNSDTGIVLNDNINITDTLSLLDGLIHTGTDTVWVMNTDTAAIQNYSDTTYVSGYLKRSISPTGGNYDFPVGSADAYELANVHFFGADTISSLTVDFSNPAGGTAIASLTDANDAVYSNLLNCGGVSPGTGNDNAGIWNIHPGKGKAVYDLNLYGRHYSNPGSMYHSIVKRNSSLLPWEFAGTYLDAELKTDTLIAKRTCLTDFYQFAIAGSNTSTPLNATPMSFSSPDNMVCGSGCIDFSSKTNFSATSWRWTLSGGIFSNPLDTSLQNPSNICFNDLGNYDVRLIASTACHADTLERPQYVKVNPIPTVTISGNNSICSGENAILTASSTGTGISYLWNNISTTAAINPSPLTNTTYNVIAATSYCSDTTTIEVNVTTMPTASISANTTAICSGESISLTTTAIADAYLWNTGETGTAIITSPMSTESYTLTINNGKCFDKNILTINVTTMPTATITTTGETSICSGKKIALSATSAVPDVTYLWSNGTSNQGINATLLTTTTYSVVLTNGICKDTASLYVSVTTTPTLILTANISTICGGDSTTLRATGIGTYLWSIGKSNNTITVAPTISQSYSLTLSNGNCVVRDSITITVIPMPTANISSPATVCSGNGTDLTASGGSTYLWSNGATSAAINTTPLINTAYTVTVSNGSASSGGLCSDTASKSITLITPIPANAGPDITIAIGLDTVLTSNYGSAWSWTPKVRLDCNTCQNPIVAPFQTTNYIVTVTDINGCISSDSVKVYVIPCAELFVPKAFSPNNDGQNDVLYIRGTDCIDKINAFTIFNRWGERVFETTDIKAGWDGSQTKETLPNEVFIYYLDALSINGDAITKTGNVTLMK